MSEPILAQRSVVSRQCLDFKSDYQYLLPGKQGISVISLWSANFKFLLANQVGWANVHHRSKYMHHQNQSNGRRYIAFNGYQNAILDYWKIRIFPQLI